MRRCPGTLEYRTWNWNLGQKKVRFSEKLNCKTSIPVAWLEDRIVQDTLNKLKL